MTIEDTVLRDLHRAAAEACSSSQADRLTYRELIMDLPGWTAEDQALLDLRLPAHLDC